MKINSKHKVGLLICILSISVLGFAMPTVAYNRTAYIRKEAEYKWLFWWFPGFALELNILATRTWDPVWEHYYFSSHYEGYNAGIATGSIAWIEYDEDVDYFYCPVCHRLVGIFYEVHGRFYRKVDSSKYYEITLAIEYWCDDNYDATFGPFIDHLDGIWAYYEFSGLLT